MPVTNMGYQENKERGDDASTAVWQQRRRNGGQPEEGRGGTTAISPGVESKIKAEEHLP